MDALAVKHVRDARSRQRAILDELDDQHKAVESKRQALAESTETIMENDPRARDYFGERERHTVMCERARVELEGIRTELALAEYGGEKLTEDHEKAVERNGKHLEAVKAIRKLSNEDGINFGDLDSGEYEEFFSTGVDGSRQFRINPTPRREMKYRGDTGDGATLVQTDIDMPPVERLKYYGSVKAYSQRFTYTGAGKLEVPIGDQTATLAVTSGTGGNMIDESYSNFDAGDKDYNVERKVIFHDHELLIHTDWTDRALRITQFSNPARFIRMLETGIAREENRMLTDSNIDGSSLTRTGVPGLRSLVPSEMLANNNAIAPAELPKVFHTPDPAYIYGSEDGIMRVEDMATGALNAPMAASSLIWMMHFTCHESLVTSAVTQTENNLQPWWLRWGEQTNFQLEIFGLPVRINNDLGALQDQPGSIAAGSRKPVLVFGRFGYLAYRECDYYMRVFDDSNTRMGAFNKAGQAALALSAFDFNGLSVGPTAGKVEALTALAHK